jgi:hypothetical protein
MFAFLGVAQCRLAVNDVSGQHIGLKDCFTLEDGTDMCPETPVTNH